jgi:chromate reductase
MQGDPPDLRRLAWNGADVSTLGVIGSAVAQSLLRGMLPILQMHVSGQPEVYLQFTPGFIDAKHQFGEQKVQAFPSNWVAKFAEHVERFT